MIFWSSARTHGFWHALKLTSKMTNFGNFECFGSYVLNSEVCLILTQMCWTWNCVKSTHMSHQNWYYGVWINSYDSIELPKLRLFSKKAQNPGRIGKFMVIQKHKNPFFKMYSLMRLCTAVGMTNRCIYVIQGCYDPWREHFLYLARTFGKYKRSTFLAFFALGLLQHGFWAIS